MLTIFSKWTPIETDHVITELLMYETESKTYILMAVANLYFKTTWVVPLSLHFVLLQIIESTFLFGMA